MKITLPLIFSLTSLFFCVSSTFAMDPTTLSPNEKPTARELYAEYGLGPESAYTENRNDGAGPSRQETRTLSPYAVPETYHRTEIPPFLHDTENPPKRVCCTICGEPCMNVIGFPFSFKETTQLFIFHQNCLEKTWTKHPEIWRYFIHTHQQVDFIELLKNPTSIPKLNEMYGQLPVVDIMQFPNYSIEQWLLQESISDLENKLACTKRCKTFCDASSVGCYVIGALILIAGIVYMIIDCESCRTDCCREENAWNDSTKAKCFFKCNPCLLSMGSMILGIAIMFCGKLIDWSKGHCEGCYGCNGSEYGLREDLAKLKSLKLDPK